MTRSENETSPYAGEGEMMVGTVPLLLAAAMLAHEANRAYCAILGDDSQVPWGDAPQWQKDSALAGVRAIHEQPDLHPEDSHIGWMALKEKEGWVYGEEKDEEAKTHPCMVAYVDLPDGQRLKDALFGANVRAVLFGVSGREAMDRGTKEDPVDDGQHDVPETGVQDDQDDGSEDETSVRDYEDGPEYKHPLGATFDGTGLTVIFHDGSTARWREGSGWKPVPEAIPGTRAAAQAARVPDAAELVEIAKD